MELRAKSRQYGIYNIRNDALRFCAGLFSMIEKHIDSDLCAVQVERVLQNRVTDAVYNPESETICQTALTGDVSTDTADRELVNEEKAQTPIPTSESCAGHGASECRDLARTSEVSVSLRVPRAC